MRALRSDVNVKDIFSNKILMMQDQVGKRNLPNIIFVLHVMDAKINELLHNKHNKIFSIYHVD